MTTEVLRNMIYAGSATLANLGFVVMDEVHYLADRFRGAVWEEVIIGLAESIQVVALVGDGEQRRGVRRVAGGGARARWPWWSPSGGRCRCSSTCWSGTRSTTCSPTWRRPPGRRPAGGSDVNPALLRVAREESRCVRDDSRRPRGAGGRGRRTVGYGSGAYGGAAHRSRPASA